ncbi:MAG TPA: hypothetical protein VFU85_02265 [Nocardioides sp.]|nr:hypothetical protein [Nocardioides sp.]
MAGTGGGARRATGAAVLLVSVALGGCTAEQPDRPISQSSAESVALRVRTVHGDTNLTPDARAEAEGAVGDVLSDYVVRAFLGDYPREDFARAFESFTGNLVREASRDLDQLTANRFREAEAVRATRLGADLSFVVQDSDIIGATASVRFAFEATVNGEERTMSLRGRLMLVEDDGAWSVFGYDLATDTGDTVDAEVS